MKVDADDRVTDVAVDYCAGEQYLASMGLFVIRRELLMREVTEAEPTTATISSATLSCTASQRPA